MKAYEVAMKIAIKAKLKAQFADLESIMTKYAQPKLIPTSQYGCQGYCLSFHILCLPCT